jgi:formate hydrogenlyase transcriptional activator
MDSSHIPASPDSQDPKNASAGQMPESERLKLLLNLTNRITSNLDLQELMRAISANIREVMQGDGAGVWLPDAASGKFRLYAKDVFHTRDLIQEDFLVTPIGPAKQALDTLKPTIVTTHDLEEGPPELRKVFSSAGGVRSFCLIPLVNRGRAVGLLAVGRTTENPFTTDEIDFLSQASGQIAVAVEHALAYKEISDLKDRLAQEKLYLEEEIRTEAGFEGMAGIVGQSHALRQVLQLVKTVAASDSTVLLLGETGTGKELIARALHECSLRKDHTLVKLNCAAIPTGLLESELFGNAAHSRGQ